MKQLTPAHYLAIGFAALAIAVGLVIGFHGVPQLSGAAGTEHYNVENFYAGINVATGTYIGPAGWDYLGSTKLSATASTTATVTVPARDMLMVCASITSYAGTSDIAALVFNGDTGTDYMSRYISVANGTTTLTDNANVNATSARMFAVAQSNGRVNCVTIANSATKDKFGSANGFSGAATSTTSTILEFGGFEWATTTQIVSVTMHPASVGNLATGTGFIVLGKNF